MFYSSQKDTSDEQIKELAQAYKESIAKELHGICGEVLVSLNRKTAILCCCAFQQIPLSTQLTTPITFGISNQLTVNNNQISGYS